MGGAKALIAMLLLTLIVSTVTYNIHNKINKNSEIDYKESVKFASQLVLSEMMNFSDVNSMYDGGAELAINMDISKIELFKDRLIRDLRSKHTGNMGISNINVPVAGYAGYDYAVAINEYNEWLPPIEYVVCNGSKTIRFTLGDKVIIDNIASIEFHIKKGSYSIYDENDNVAYTLTGIDNFDDLVAYRDYVVMSTIERYINLVGYKDYRGSIRIQKSNYTSDKTIYNEGMPVIEGPSLFAMIDCYRGSGSREKLYERTLAFGGSEMIVK